MKGLVFMLFVFVQVICIQLNGQALTDTEFVGIWNVSEVHTSPVEMTEEQKQTMEVLKSAFLKSEFHFKENKDFVFDFEFGEVSVDDGYWKFDNSSSSFTIRKRNNNEGVLMIIKAKKESGKIFFELAESPFSLEMKKVK